MKDHQIDLEELIAEAKNACGEDPSWLEEAMTVEGALEKGEDDDVYNICISPEVAEILKLFGISESQLIEKVKESVRRSASR